MRQDAHSNHVLAACWQARLQRRQRGSMYACKEPGDVDPDVSPLAGSPAAVAEAASGDTLPASNVAAAQPGDSSCAMPGTGGVRLEPGSRVIPCYKL